MLAPDFALYNTEELRMVMGTQISTEQMEWMHNYYRVRNLRNDDYNTGCIEPAQEWNVGGAPVRYAVVDFVPNTLGGQKYFAEEYYDTWNEKYTLELHDKYFDYKIDYGPNEKGQYYNAQWITTKAGGVCNHISNTGALVRNSFGLASIPMYQWPNHASFLIYNRNNGNPVCGSGYDVYEMPSSSTKKCQTSTIPAGHTHLFNNWGNQSYLGIRNIGYVFMGIDSMYNRYSTNLEKARILTYMGDIQFSKENYTGAEALYRNIAEIMQITI